MNNIFFGKRKFRGTRTKAEGKLSEYQYVKQLQINLGNGKYFVSDNAWVKRITGAGEWECYIGESKLSSFTDLSDNQGLFKTQFNNGTGTTNFTTRNSLNGPLSQNSTLKVKAAIRTNRPGNNILLSSF